MNIRRLAQLSRGWLVPSPESSAMQMALACELFVCPADCFVTAAKF